MSLISRWLPVLLWATVIFTLSSIPTLPKVEIIWWDFLLKKTAHVIEYAILFSLLIRALQAKTSPKLTIVAFIIAVVYALSDEFHQSFVPGRTARLTDVGFDTFGMLLANYKLKSTQ